MSYRDMLVKLGDTTEEKVLAVYRLFDAGDLSRFDAIALMSTLIGKAQATAIVLAESSLAAELILSTAEAVPVVATAVRGDVVAVRQAVITTLGTAATTPDIEGRIARMARGITYRAAADAYSDGVKKSPRTEGWIRDLEPDACQMCTWWWREGRVWPKDHPMPTHPGCTCAPKPVLRKGIGSTGKTRAMTGERQARKPKIQPVLGG